MCKRNGRRKQGAALVEFSLSFLLFLTLVIGLMELGRMVWAYTTIDHATRQAARYAMAHGSLNAATPEQIRKVLLSNAVGLDPKNILVKTTWSAAYERGNFVQVQGQYRFAPVTSRLILRQNSFWLSATSRMVIAN
jgi:Flp pilus assembly protein TadG